MLRQAAISSFQRITASFAHRQHPPVLPSLMILVPDMYPWWYTAIIFLLRDELVERFIREIVLTEFPEIHNHAVGWKQIERVADGMCRCWWFLHAIIQFATAIPWRYHQIVTFYTFRCAPLTPSLLQRIEQILYRFNNVILRFGVGRIVYSVLNGHSGAYALLESKMFLLVLFFIYRTNISAT